MRPAGRRVASRDGGPLVEIGRIVNRHGIHGEVRVLPHNPETTTLNAVEWVVLRDANTPGERRRVVARRRHKRFVLLRLEGCDTANDAEALVGRTVCVPREQLPPRQPHEVYQVDLIGCTVRTDSGDDLGTVREIFATGSNDVCVVWDGTREYLIPLIADVIVRLDPAAGEIVIHPVPGLLDP